jgi:hypothetical protein
MKPQGSTLRRRLAAFFAPKVCRGAPPSSTACVRCRAPRVCRGVTRTQRDGVGRGERAAERSRPIMHMWVIIGGLPLVLFAVVFAMEYRAVLRSVRRRAASAPAAARPSDAPVLRMRPHATAGTSRRGNGSSTRVSASPRARVRTNGRGEDRVAIVHPASPAP